MYAAPLAAPVRLQGAENQVTKATEHVTEELTEECVWNLPRVPTTEVGALLMPDLTLPSDLAAELIAPHAAVCDMVPGEPDACVDCGQMRLAPSPASMRLTPAPIPAAMHCQTCKQLEDCIQRQKKRLRTNYDASSEDEDNPHAKLARQRTGLAPEPPQPEDAPPRPRPVSLDELATRTQSFRTSPLARAEMDQLRVLHERLSSIDDGERDALAGQS